MSLTRPDVIVFDVNETLSDMSPLGERFSQVGASASLAPLWFATVLREGFALTAAGSTERFSDIAREVLLDLLPDRVGDADDAATHILGGFSELDVHPDVVPGVQALADTGVRLVTLSNGAAQVADTLLENAGVRDRFDRLLSVEDAGAWKPHPESYAYAAETLGVQPASMLMVAAHPWDIDGAARAGLQTAYVDRTGRRYPAYDTPPVLTVGSLVELAAAVAAS